MADLDDVRLLFTLAFQVETMPWTHHECLNNWTLNNLWLLALCVFT